MYSCPISNKASTQIKKNKPIVIYTGSEIKLAKFIIFIIDFKMQIEQQIRLDNQVFILEKIIKLILRLPETIQIQFSYGYIQLEKEKLLSEYFTQDQIILAAQLTDESQHENQNFIDDASQAMQNNQIQCQNINQQEQQQSEISNPQSNKQYAKIQENNDQLLPQQNNSQIADSINNQEVNNTNDQFKVICQFNKNKISFEINKKASLFIILQIIQDIYQNKNLQFKHKQKNCLISNESQICDILIDGKLEFIAFDKENNNDIKFQLLESNRQVIYQ